MDEFKNLIHNGWVEIDTARMVSFELAIETGKNLNPLLESSLKLSKKSVSEDNRFILSCTRDERFIVEMRKGMTYFYNTLMWKVKPLENQDDTNGRNEMPYIYETRSVRHDAGPDMRFQLKEFLMQEVNRAWAENDPYGEISCKWNEESVHVLVKVGKEVRSLVTFDIQREPKGVLE